MPISTRRFTSRPKPAARVFSYMSMMSSASTAQAVAHAIIAREVRRGLGRRDDVIGGQRIFRVRQRDVDDLGAGGREPFDPLLPQRLDLVRHAVDAIFLRHAELQALDALADRRLVVRHRRRRPRSCPSDRRPAIDVSRIAASRTSRAIGPAWSSDEAKATMPQREQRP